MANLLLTVLFCGSDSIIIFLLRYLKNDGLKKCGENTMNDTRSTFRIIPVLPAILALIFVYLINFIRYVRKYPKGPLPLPFIGNIHLIKDPTKLDVQFQEWSKVYGPIFTVFMPSPIVVIMNYEGIRDALVVRGDDYVGRTGKFPETMFMCTENGGISFSQGANWTIQRRTALQILRDFGMGRNVMEHKVKLSVSALCDHIDSMADRERVDLRWPIQVMVANVINQVLYGWQYEYNSFERLRNCCDQLEDIATVARAQKLTLVVMKFPWVRHLPILGYHGYYKFIEMMKPLHAMAREDLNNSLKLYNADDEPQCFVHAYNQKICKGVDPYINTNQLQNVAMDFYLAGMETMTTTTRWGILYLCGNQDVQEKMRQEIHSLIGKETMVTMADKVKLPYTLATIYEIQRKANILPVNVFHRTVRDTEVLGRSVPEDTLVLAQIGSVLNTDPLFDDPDQFRPERFLMENGKTLNKVVMDHVVPFSMGKRQCAGEGMARVELFIGLATLVQRYRILPSDGQTLDTTPKASVVNLPKDHYYKIKKL